MYSQEVADAISRNQRRFPAPQLVTLDTPEKVAQHPGHRLGDQVQVRGEPEFIAEHAWEDGILYLMGVR